VKWTGWGQSDEASPDSLVCRRQWLAAHPSAPVSRRRRAAVHAAARRPALPRVVSAWGCIVSRSHWLLVAMALTLARCSYDSGHRNGVEAGYWDCAAELGVVG
jgi:hypothetical protein